MASQGGHLSYSFGAPGREIAVAAGARLAAERGTPLTVIDFRHVQAQIRSIVTDLHPGLPCTVLAAGEAVQQTPSPEGVWVIHTDLLRAPSTHDALLALARTAGILITAGRDDRGEPFPDAVAAPRFVFQPSDLNITAPHSKAALQWTAPARPEHEQRLLRLISPASEQDPVSVEEFDLPHPDPGGESHRSEQTRDDQRQRAADDPVSGRPAAHSHGPEQARAPRPSPDRN